MTNGNIIVVEAVKCFINKFNEGIELLYQESIKVSINLF